MISKIKPDPLPQFSFSQERASLCTDCIHEPNCVFTTTGSSTLICEEYMSAKVIPKKRVTKNTVQLISNFAGLCSHCDYARQCSLRTPESIIFNCEHYQ